MRVGVQKKDKFFIQQKKREPMKGTVLSQPLLSFLSNISSSTFCTVCDHFKSYFLPETELKGETVWCWYVERNSQRAAKLGRFWEKVTLVKAQSLKLNSAAAPLLFFSFRQLPKRSLEQSSWEKICPEKKLLSPQLYSGVFQSVSVAIIHKRLLLLSGITSTGYGSTHHHARPIELFKFSKY